MSIGRLSEREYAIGIGIRIIAVGDALRQVPVIAGSCQVGDFGFVATAGKSQPLSLKMTVAVSLSAE